MNRILISMATMALLVAALPASAAWQHNGGSIDARQHEQRVRIVDGARSGDLTNREARGLLDEQRAIRRTEHRYRSDGILTGGERRALHSELNRASRHIYNQRHDYERRWPDAEVRYGRHGHYGDVSWHDRGHHHHHGRYHGPRHY